MSGRNMLLHTAVHQNGPLSRRGLQERLFTALFSGFVYPQIWEDPRTDLAALELKPSDTVITIASGGCNVLNYLAANPARIIAVDLNPAHVALTRLKLTALKVLDDYEPFFRFFGRADDPANPEVYDRQLRTALDEQTRSFWDAKHRLRGRRIDMFKRGLYRHGLLGRFIGTAHFLARINGKDPKQLLAAKTPEDQRTAFEELVAPFFDAKIVKILCKLPFSLFGLGIPPAQYEALRNSNGDGDIVGVLRERVERLVCDFPLDENYFAWQAFARGYDCEAKRAVPDYLLEENFSRLKQNADRVEVHHAKMDELLKTRPARSISAFVLLDAQDWMTPQQMTELWTEIDRCAADGAKVIFRTAGPDSPLPEALPAELFSSWDYDEAECRRLHATDRSSIYGGFHCYRRRPDA